MKENKNFVKFHNEARQIHTGVAVLLLHTAGRS
jgi:hypothetical protein